MIESNSTLESILKEAKSLEEELSGMEDFTKNSLINYYTQILRIAEILDTTVKNDPRSKYVDRGPLCEVIGSSRTHLLYLNNLGTIPKGIDYRNDLHKKIETIRTIIRAIGEINIQYSLSSP